MERSQFLNGLKIFWSSGGVNPDEDTLEVWYQMLKMIDPEDYKKAIVHLMQNEKELQRVNFIFEITERSRMFRTKREADNLRNNPQLPPKDLIPPEKLKVLIHDLAQKLALPKESDAL